MLGKNAKPPDPPLVTSIPETKKPSMRNVYHSNHVQVARKQEEDIVTARFQPVSKEPVTDDQKIKTVWSPLLGKNVAFEEFSHQNMQPFGAPRQQQLGTITEALPVFERFTGQSSIEHRPKREQENLFTMTRDIGNMHGMQTPNDMEKMRLENSLQSQKNMLPFEQVRVGPGVGGGFTDQPMDKLEQDLQIRNIVMPKSIDQLRSSANQRIQYSGTVIESGLKESRRAEAIPLARNRPENKLERTQDHLFRTTGAYLKDAVQPDVEAKDTNRNDTTGQYTGNPGVSNGQRVQDKSTIRASDKEHGASLGVRNATMANTIKHKNEDYGKGSIQVYTNNRDTTTVTTYKGSLSTAVKAMIAPITDMLTITKKDIYAEHPRTYGNMHVAIPEKGPTRTEEGLRATVKQTTLNEAPVMNVATAVPKITVGHDDVTRITIKETVLAPTATTNLRGPTRIAVYDPDDITRATMKQTTLHATQAANMVSGAHRGVVFDDTNPARLTVKQTTLHAAQAANMVSGVHRGTVYDDTNPARLTVKQTTLHETEAANAKPGVHRGVVYDQENPARLTVRQTTLHETEAANAAPGVHRGVVYDQENPARLTVKQTTLHEADAANMVSGVHKGMVYDDTQGPRPTVKETTLDHEAPTYLRMTEARGQAVDPDARARTTGRQTLDVPNGKRVTRGDKAVGQAFDPDAPLRPTTKQTTLVPTTKTNATMVYSSAPGGYVDANVEAKDTERDGYTDVDYYGAGADAQQDGYKIAKFDAKETNHESTTGEYYGTGQGKDLKPKSYSDMYAATLNELREETLVKREPTQTGAKVTYGKDDVNSSVNKQSLEYDATDFFEEHRERTVTDRTVSDRTMLPRDTRDDYAERENTIDYDIMRQLDDNPYFVRTIV